MQWKFQQPFVSWSKITLLSVFWKEHFHNKNMFFWVKICLFRDFKTIKFSKCILLSVLENWIIDEWFHWYPKNTDHNRISFTPVTVIPPQFGNQNLVSVECTALRRIWYETGLSVSLSPMFQKSWPNPILDWVQELKNSDKTDWTSLSQNTVCWSKRVTFRNFYSSAYCNTHDHII